MSEKTPRENPLKMYDAGNCNCSTSESSGSCNCGGTGTSGEWDSGIGGQCGVTGTISDFITGKELADTVSEKIRQETERFLVNEKGYLKSDISVGEGFQITLATGEKVYYNPDLIVSKDSRRIIVINCIDGALVVGERLVLAYARLLDSYQVPYNVIVNDMNANVLDTISGKSIGSGLEAIPSKSELNIGGLEFVKLPENRVEKEKRILYTFESINETVCTAFKDKPGDNLQ